MLLFDKLNDYFGLKYCFARNEYNYYYNIEYGVMKKYIREEKVIDICCCYRHSTLLT